MTIEKAEKDFFEGDFNWKGETYHFFRYAQGESHARQLMIRALAKKVERPIRSLMYEFNGQKDNFQIRRKLC